MASSENPSEIRGSEIPTAGENPREKDKGKVPKNGGQNVRLKKAGDLENRRYEIIVLLCPKSKPYFEMTSFGSI